MKVTSAFVTDWDNILLQFPEEQYDIFHLKKYADLYISADDKLIAFYYEDHGFQLLYPLLIKKIGTSDQCDFESPYGYSGPCWNIYDQVKIENALSVFMKSLKEMDVVTGFVRNNPFLNNHINIDGYHSIYERDLAVMDLRFDEVSIYEDILHQKNRNSINKAQRLGLTFHEDKLFHHYDLFVELYRQTMTKLGADEFYYFSNEFFQELKSRFPDKLQLFYVKYEEKIISMCTSLKHANIAHYFLSASDSSMMKLSPNNLMVFKTAITLKHQGIEFFNLGGGRTGNNDLLFQFKSRFTKTFRPFYISKIVVNKRSYDNLIGDWDKTKSQELKQKYGHLFQRYKYE